MLTALFSGEGIMLQPMPHFYHDESSGTASRRKLRLGRSHMLQHTEITGPLHQTLENGIKTAQYQNEGVEL